MQCILHALSFANTGHYMFSLQPYIVWYETAILVRGLIRHVDAFLLGVTFVMLACLSQEIALNGIFIKIYANFLSHMQ